MAKAKTAPAKRGPKRADLSEHGVKPLGKTTESIMAARVTLYAATLEGKVSVKVADTLEKMLRGQSRDLAATEVERLAKILRDAERLNEAGVAHQARERQHVAATKDGEHFDG